MSKVHRASDSSGAISVTVAPNKPWKLEEIRLHLDAGGGATDLTVTMDSGVNTGHDVVFYTKAMSGIADVNQTWEPDGRKMLHKNDKVVIAYTNGGAAAWGLEVIYSILE